MAKKVLVHPIRLGATSAFLLRGTRPILVDTGGPGSSRRLLDILEQYRVDLRDISLIVLTHAHIDHYGNAEELRRLTGAPLAIHHADAKALASGEGAAAVPVTMMARFTSALRSRQSKIPGIEADILLGDFFDLEPYGISGKIMHTPGHTLGSVSILLDSGEAIVGDTIMAMNPFAGPKRPMFINDPQALEESLLSLKEMRPSRVFLTHGGAFDGGVLSDMLMNQE